MCLCVHYNVEGIKSADYNSFFSFIQIIAQNLQVRAVVNVPGMVLLREGHLVAVNCANSATELAIAECIGVNDNDVEVEWLRGSYTTTRVQWCIRDPQKRRSTIWRDTIPIYLILS